MKSDPLAEQAPWQEGEFRDSAFISPFGSNRQVIEERCHKLLGDLIAWSSDSLDARVLPNDLQVDVELSDLFARPRSFQEIRAVLQEILGQSLNPNNPRFMGHMDSMPTLYSVLGDLLASGMNNNLFALEMSPVLTRVENALIGEFCRLFGYPADAGGLILDGGSLANLQALTVARNATLGSNDGDVRQVEERLVLFCSQDAHVSIDKTAMILGVGRDAVRRVPTDERGRMDAKQLESALAKAKEEGLRPFAVVSTAGTTVTGSVDPVAQIDQVAKRFGVWHHVDAIWGGGLIFAQGEHRKLLQGIEVADSITFNPQKWMMVAKTCSLALFQRDQDLEEYMRIGKSYIRERDDVVDLSEIGIAGTKRASCLKLLLSVLALGSEGYNRFVHHTLEMTRYFRQLIARTPYLQLTAEPDTAMLCMRGIPEGLSPQEQDDWNRDLQTYLWEEKNVFFSLPTYRERTSLRIVLLNPYLSFEIIDEVFAHIEKFHERWPGSR